MKKTLIVLLVLMVLCVFINCINYRVHDASNRRSKRSKYFYGYVYDINERKPIPNIRIYPNCRQLFCTEDDRVGIMTDENGYFKVSKPDNLAGQHLVVEFEGEIIDSILTLAGPIHRGFLLFLDPKRVDTIFVNMTTKAYIGVKVGKIYTNGK